MATAIVLIIITLVLISSLSIFGKNIPRIKVNNKRNKSCMLTRDVTRLTKPIEIAMIIKNIANRLINTLNETNVAFFLFFTN